MSSDQIVEAFYNPFAQHHAPAAPARRFGPPDGTTAGVYFSDTRRTPQDAVGKFREALARDWNCRAVRAGCAARSTQHWDTPPIGGATP